MTVGHTSAVSFFPASREPLLDSLQHPKQIRRPLNPIISQLQRCRSLDALKSIHAAMIKSNTYQDSFFMNQFISACSRLHQMDYGFLAFTKMADPNVFVFNAVIAGLVRCSSLLEAIHLYIHMSRLTHIAPTSYTFSSLIKACVGFPAVGFGESLHGRISKMGFGSHVFVQTGLIDLYSTLEKIGEANRVFDEMQQRDVFSWTTMISCHVRFGDLHSARRLFDEMPARNCASWNTMIAGYARSGNVEGATSLFNQMPDKDLISWTTMIACYAHNKRFRESIETFERMKPTGVAPDEVTMVTVISACAHLGALDIGKRLHHHAMTDGFDLDVYIGSSLVDMYAKCGSIERSMVVFLKLKEKNLFCWNSMIEGLAIHGRGKDAVDMFNRMKNKGKTEPNWVTFVSVLSACTHSGMVEEGQGMFSSMVKEHLISPHIEHYGCMVDLLGRAGLLEEALDLIRTMEIEPNSVVWGTLLSGCKIYGNLAIGEVAVEKLIGLEPENSGYYVLLVNMYVESNKWREVARVRGVMKARGVKKRSHGCSWIEIDGVVHEFGACDMSHFASNEICFLLVGLDGQMKLAGYKPDWVSSL